ncbi:hypothetical protein ACLOJK_029875, partial [Asimina triloba]
GVAKSVEATLLYPTVHLQNLRKGFSAFVASLSIRIVGCKASSTVSPFVHSVSLPLDVLHLPLIFTNVVLLLSSIFFLSGVDVPSLSLSVVVPSLSLLSSSLSSIPLLPQCRRPPVRLSFRSPCLIHGVSYIHYNPQRIFL